MKDYKVLRGMEIKEHIMISAKYHMLVIMLMPLATASCQQEAKPIAFVSEERHRDHLDKMNEINARMLSDLGKYGVHDNSALSLNFYFVTDDSLKALGLAAELENTGYHTNPVHASPKDHTLWVITGNVASVSMDSSALNQWASSICEVGYKHDCEFQGWNPVSE